VKGPNLHVIHFELPSSTREGRKLLGKRCYPRALEPEPSAWIEKNGEANPEHTRCSM